MGHAGSENEYTSSYDSGAVRVGGQKLSSRNLDGGRRKKNKNKNKKSDKTIRHSRREAGNA